MARASRAVIEFVSGLLAGITVGYAVALLLAPAEGSEARARVREGADAFRLTPRQVADEVHARIHHAVEQGRQAAADARAELEAAAGLHPFAPSDDSPGQDDAAVI